MNQPVSRKLFFWILVVISIITLSAPTLVVLGASLTSGNIIVFPPDGLSLKVQSSRGKAGIAGCVYTFNLGGHNLCVYLFACGDLGGDCPSKVSITQGRFDSDLSPVTFHNPTDWIGNRIDVGLW